jgi:hypothetical protein
MPHRPGTRNVHLLTVDAEMAPFFNACTSRDGMLNRPRTLAQRPLMVG